MIKAALISAGLAFTVSPGLAAQASPPVVPGHTLGRITLGMARRDVWRRYGRPSYSKSLRWQGHSYCLDDWGRDRGAQNVTLLSEQGHVMQIECDDPVFQRTFGQIRKEHPQVQVQLNALRQETGDIISLDDVRQGIAWLVYTDHSDTFPTEGLTTLGTTKVIVHRAGQSALPDAAVAEHIRPPGCLHTLHAWFAKKN